MFAADCCKAQELRVADLIKLGVQYKIWRRCSNLVREHVKIPQIIVLLVVVNEEAVLENSKLVRLQA